MIVRWGLDALPDVLAELSVSDPLLVSTGRWCPLELPVARRFYGVQPHAEVIGVREATAAAEGVDGLVALRGRSAIDTAKAVSSETGLPIVSIPTTYSGAEWTQGYGMRDRDAGVKRGGAGARTAAIVYDPALTLDLPADHTAGSSMNALGGRYGLAHGTMNAVSLPAALRYNWDFATPEINRFGEAMGTDDPIGRAAELAALAGSPRLRDHDVRREDLPSLAEAIAERASANANPRPAPPEAVLTVLEEIW